MFLSFFNPLPTIFYANTRPCMIWLVMRKIGGWLRPAIYTYVCVRTMVDHTVNSGRKEDT